MSYIPLGALQRLSGHDHIEIAPGTPNDIVFSIIETCTHCRAIADAFKEGHEAGYEDGRDSGVSDGWEDGVDYGRNNPE